jgi:uncharacterized lipoprotein YajG
MKKRFIFTFAILLVVACASKQRIILTEFALYQNVPNPFEKETWIPYDLAGEANVSITIHDTQGKIIRTLKLGTQHAGSYQAKDKAAYWDGRTDKGDIAPGGIYFYNLTIGDFQETKKMLKLK